MDPAETLQTLAEVSIAFTGFSALIVALRAPQIGGLDSPGNRLGLALLFGWSLSALLMSLIPLILSASGVGPDDLWSIASGLAGAFFLVGGTAVAIANVRLPTEEQIGRLVLTLGGALHVGIAATLIWNAIGPSSPGLLLGSIVVMLGFAAWTMLYFIFPPAQNQRP